MVPHAITVTIAALLLCGCGTDNGTPATTTEHTTTPSAALRLETFELPAGSGAHDVAPAADGGVWFTAQHAGYLGHLNPASKRVTQIPLGTGSHPHGVIVGKDARPG